MTRFSMCVFCSLILASCSLFEVEQISPIADDERTMDELVVPQNFTFDMQAPLSLTLKAVNNAGDALAAVPYEVGCVTEGDTLWMATGIITSASGTTVELTLPTGATEVLVGTVYMGLPNLTASPLTSNHMEMTLGSSNTLEVHLCGPSEGGATHEGLVERGASFTYMGSYNNQGLPNYLMAQGDVISPEVLEIVNASLPEGMPVPSHNPGYIANGTQTNVVLTDSAQVWITFVHEGAGYQNAIGYYSYPTNNPPTTAAQINQLKVIFPNTSFQGSGGQMHTGDKVYLGAFSGGTTVAWFLVPNGWKSSTQKVSDSGVNIHYSNKDFNTFTSAANRSHMVLLADDAHELLLMGFEDIDRPGGDKDFNDAIFYVKATPFSAVQTTNMAVTTLGSPDSDGDGVADNYDEADFDPSYAFTAHYPAKNVNGSLAFEDAWPSKGDYDMNDMVVDYHYEQRLDAANKVTAMRAQFSLRAMGASFRNGFGIALPIDWASVSSVTGQHITENWISLRSNGTENNQSKAVIMAFDNGYSLIPTVGGAFVNTDKSQAPVSAYNMELAIAFTSPLTQAQLGSSPFNPFLVVNKERGREVHLPGQAPTQLANSALFQTGVDKTMVGTSNTYKTANGLPWALNFISSFQYPIEKAPINQAYLKFNQWATSGGTTFTNWHTNTSSNRNANSIY